MSRTVKQKSFSECLLCLHQSNQKPHATSQTENTENIWLSVCLSRKKITCISVHFSERMIPHACFTCCNACVNDFRCRTHTKNGSIIYESRAKNVLLLLNIYSWSERHTSVTQGAFPQPSLLFCTYMFR